MTDTKFTPAPWRVEESAHDAPHSVDAIDPKDGRNFELCTVWGEDDHSAATPTAEANAQLISSAPRMYKALEELVNVAMRFGIPTIEAEIALAQARGETDAT